MNEVFPQRKIIATEEGEGGEIKKMLRMKTNQSVGKNI